MSSDLRYLPDINLFTFSCTREGPESHIRLQVVGKQMYYFRIQHARHVYMDALPHWWCSCAAIVVVDVVVLMVLPRRCRHRLGRGSK